MSAQAVDRQMCALRIEMRCGRDFKKEERKNENYINDWRCDGMFSSVFTFFLTRFNERSTLCDAHIICIHT